MAYNRILKSVGLFILGGAWCLQACTDNDGSDYIPQDEDEVLSDPYGLMKVTEADLTPDVFRLILQDDEPSTTYFDNDQRSFYVNRPLQISVNDKQELVVRFYSPRPIHGVTVWAKINGYDEEFQLAQFDVVPAFAEYHRTLPILAESKLFVTRSGKEIQIMANPHLSASDFSLTASCSDSYYQKLISTKCKFRVCFSAYDQAGYWKSPLLAAHARETVAIMLNFAYMFPSSEFAEELEKYRGKLHSDNNLTLVDVDRLLEQVISHSDFRVGHVSGVNGLGGGGTYGLNEWCFLEHYADDTNETHTIFHELGHCLGYGHDGNMTYEQTGPGWITLCNTVYTRLCIEKKLPVYSRRFMHTRKNGKLYGAARYQRSKYVIEDPELDAIDGGLAPALNADDENYEEGTSLACVISYKDIPGAAKETFAPKDVCVCKNRIYIVNDASGEYSLEVLEENEGKITHVKSVKEWTENAGTGTFAGKPTGVTVAHGKVYVTNEGSRTDVFDESTLEFITCIGNGSWGESSTQTVHAFDVLVKRGCVFIRDKRRVCVFMESDAVAGSYQKVANYCRSINMGEAMGTYGQATGTDGLLYTTHQNNRKLYVFDCNSMREQTEWEARRVTDLPFSPYDVAFAGERMFVSFARGKNQPVALAEVNKENGAILKDYTSVGGHVFQDAEKMTFSRQTLFVIDRTGHAVIGIPVNELN